MCMQYEDVHEHERIDDNNNNNNNGVDNQYGDVFDTTNINIDNDCYYSTTINNYQPQNYQIYFDEECYEFTDKPKKSANYECVSNAAGITHSKRCSHQFQLSKHRVHVVCIRGRSSSLTPVIAFVFAQQLQLFGASIPIP